MIPRPLVAVVAWKLARLSLCLCACDFSIGLGQHPPRSSLNQMRPWRRLEFRDETGTSLRVERRRPRITQLTLSLKRSSWREPRARALERMLLNCEGRQRAGQRLAGRFVMTQLMEIAPPSQAELFGGHMHTYTKRAGGYQARSMCAGEERVGSDAVLK